MIQTNSKDRREKHRKVAGETLSLLSSRQLTSVKFLTFNPGEAIKKTITEEAIGKDVSPPSTLSHWGHIKDQTCTEEVQLLSSL